MTNQLQESNPGPEEILRARLVLQLGLEASLEKSRKALLALNLSELVIETREQIMLSRGLAIVEASTRNDADKKPERRPERATSDSILAHAVVQVRASGRRIQSAIRLQLALLARSRQKLRVMANMLAWNERFRES